MPQTLQFVLPKTSGCRYHFHMAKRPLKLTVGEPPERIEFDTFGGPEGWVRETLALVDASSHYPSGAGDRGAKQRHSYEEFIWIIYKYAALLKLQVMIEFDKNDPEKHEVILTFFGQTLNPNAIGAKERPFQLPLNDAIELGLRPDQF